MGEDGEKKSWRAKAKSAGRDARTSTVRIGTVLVALAVVAKLIFLQVVDHPAYAALAEGQHGIFKKLFPTRGDILVHDGKDGTVMPVATNQRLWLVFAEPRHLEDPMKAAGLLSEALGYDDEKKKALEERLSRPNDGYEPIEHRVSDETLEKIEAIGLKGVKSVEEEGRLYPEPKLGGQVFGFVGSGADGTMSGKYGIEGYFDKELAGKAGSLRSERDISGRLIAVGANAVDPAIDGDDIVLTIDRNIQYAACKALVAAVAQHQADGGSVIILEPSTGRVLAMCGAPDFDPNTYASTPDIRVFNNPAIFDSFEPGSIFKTITMAASVDAGAVGPNTTYEDTGKVHIDRFDISNSDHAAHGVQTMTNVLEKSLNTGAIFAMRAMGRDTFQEYVKKFGFGVRSGIELETESAGDIRSLDKPSEVFPATASYGQGITVTPLQMAAAYAAIADGGILKEPRIVDEIRHADGTVEHRDTVDVRRVIETKTSRLLGAMLIAVVENGHGKQAGVKGYYIAGKTGTAQVAKTDGTGYEEDKTIGTFAGFGPVEDPKFVMVVRIDHPRDAPWAESTAAPLFGQIASYLLQYFEVPPTRK
jgi:cell division protein FtsI/penicillin-binding protein 2